MSLFKSWLQSPLPPTWIPPNSVKSVTANEPTEATSTINASVQSSHPYASARELRSDDASIEHYLALKRRENGLHLTLQRLLDVQSSALSAGSTQEDSVSDRTSESTTRADLSRVTPVRQPKDKPLSLRAVRREITQSMRELSIVKAEEQTCLHSRRVEAKAVQDQAQQWERRQKDLNRELDTLQSAERGHRANELKEQSSALEEQIQQMELQLSELKSRHRVVSLELARLENSEQAEMSSYKAALSQIEADVQKFLARAPVQPLEQPGSDSYLHLPKKRRTLGMALDYLENEEKIIDEHLRTAENEWEALEDGIVLWADAVSDISAFEAILRTGLQKLHLTAGDARDKDFMNNFEQLQARLSDTIRQVEGKMKIAETNGWNLLVCCIGAELEALREGQTVLQQSVPVSEEASVIGGNEVESTVSSASTVKSIGMKYRPPSQNSRDSSGSGDSQPDGLLVDHQADEDEPDPVVLGKRISQDLD